MVSPTVKQNRLNSMQNYLLVPIESLATSPTSSTGTASVLEWNSNSDGELLQLSSPSASLTAPLSPPPLSPSVIFALPSPDDSTNRNDPMSHSDTHIVDAMGFSSSESTIPDVWTPLFDGLVTPAPTFSRDNTIVVDGDSATAADLDTTIRPSQDQEVDKLRDLFDNGFWREPLSNIGLPQSSSEAEETRSPTPASNVSAMSMSNTVVLPQLHNTSSSPPVLMSSGPYAKYKPEEYLNPALWCTEDTISTPTDERTTALLKNMLFKTPPRSPASFPPSCIKSNVSTPIQVGEIQVPTSQKPTPISIVSDEIPQKSTPIPISVVQAAQRPRAMTTEPRPIAETISIAEYFQRKAMVSDTTPLRTRVSEPEPELLKGPTLPTSKREVQIEADEEDEIFVPRRPASSHSALSYVTEPSSPLLPPIPIEELMNQPFSSPTLSPSPVSASVSQLVVDQTNVDSEDRENLFLSSSPVERRIPLTSEELWTGWSGHPRLSPFSPSGHTESELDASFVDWLNTYPKKQSTESFSFPSSGPRRPVFIPNYSAPTFESARQKYFKEQAAPVPLPHPSVLNQVSRRNAVRSTNTAWQYPVSSGTWILPPERTLEDMTTPERAVLTVSPMLSSCTRISSDPDPVACTVSPRLSSCTRISFEPEHEIEERKSPVNVPAKENVEVPQTLPRSTFSSSPLSEEDHNRTYPNIPTWLVNSARASLPVSSTGWSALSVPVGKNNTSGTSKLRPLPPAPTKVDVTPQFALRSELDTKPRVPEEQCYALPQPTTWGACTVRTPVTYSFSPPPPAAFSPVPVASRNVRNRNRYSCPSESTLNSPASDGITIDGDPPIPTVSHPPPPAAPRPPVIESCTSPHLASCGLYPSPNPLPPPPMHVPSQPLVNPPFYRSPPSGSSYCQPTYTDSTLPRDRRLPPPSSPNWNWDPHHGYIPAQNCTANATRRLRFAASPPATAAAGLNYKCGGIGLGSVPASSFPQQQPQPTTGTGVIPPYATLGPTFFNNNNNGNGFIYQTPAPVIPQFPSVATTSNATLSSSNWGFPSNKKFWFVDGSVIFRVEDCLYKVHRHFFEKYSDYISRLLTTYGPYDLSNHVFLPDVKKVDFERLLSIFYPTDLTKSDITTVSGWTSILRLSQKWQMKQLAYLAVQRLTPLTTSIEKLSIARKYNFQPNHEWMVPAYVDLCSRRTPLTLNEAEELDLATVLKVWEVQNLILGWQMSWGGPTCPLSRIEEMVKEQFGYVTGYPSHFSASPWDSLSRRRMWG